MKLNLGCGGEIMKGYINCDFVKLPGIDKVINLEKKLPLKNNSVDEIIIFHVLEHINNLMQLMDEFGRVCKPGAKIKIKVPYFRFPGAFENPNHVRFFTANSFNYFNSKEFENYSKVKFKIDSQKLIFNPRKKFISKIFDFFINLNINKYERYFSSIFSAEEIKLVLINEK